MAKIDLETRPREKQLFYDMTNLQLWHIFDMVSAEYKPFDKAMACWTPFYRYFQEPNSEQHTEQSWLEFVDNLKTIYMKLIKKGIDYAVDRAVEYAFPVIKKRREEKSLPAKGGRFGSFRYDYNSTEHLVALHFRNAYVPETPFKHMNELFTSLNEMNNDILQKASEVQRIGCGSWINNLGAFQRLFPQSYIDSLVLTSPDRKTGGGWWGQFVNQKGELHQERAELLKRERKFMFPRLYGECDFEDFRNHVLSNLK